MGCIARLPWDYHPGKVSTSGKLFTEQFDSYIHAQRLLFLKVFRVHQTTIQGSEIHVSTPAFLLFSNPIFYLVTKSVCKVRLAV